MMKLYSLFILLVMVSCTPRIGYVGSSYAPSEKVDVFVDEATIKKEYDVVGKGYVRSTYWSKPETIQSKAIAKAKAKGADAILVKDYFSLDGLTVNATVRSDSTGKGILVKPVPLNDAGATGLIVYFLKYR